jgi:hypothetical protein
VIEVRDALDVPVKFNGHQVGTLTVSRGSLRTALRERGAAQETVLAGADGQIVDVRMFR